MTEAGSACREGGRRFRSARWLVPGRAPVPFAVSGGSCLCPGTATGQRTPGRALCTPRPCASPARRCAVPSLTPASRGPAAIRSCSPRPFADVLSAHPGTAPSLGGPGWRFPLLLLFSLYYVFYGCGFCPQVQTLRPFKNEKMNMQAGRGRYPQRRAQRDGQDEPAGRRRERGVSRSESARSVKAGGMRPGIREDGAGRGLLRGAPTRPLARPRAAMPLKLPEVWRAESPQSPALLSHPAPRRCSAPSPALLSALIP